MITERENPLPLLNYKCKITFYDDVLLVIKCNANYAIN